MKKFYFFLVSLFIYNTGLAQSQLKTNSQIFGDTKIESIQYKSSNNKFSIYSRYSDTSYKMMEPIFNNTSDFKAISDEIDIAGQTSSDKESHVLTLRFDIPVNPLGHIFITNEDLIITNDELIWTANNKAKIFLEEGEYHIMVQYFSYYPEPGEDSCLYMVMVPNIVLDDNLDTIINIEKLATNYVSLDFRDELNNVISPKDTNIIEYDMEINIKYPEYLKFNHLSNTISKYPVNYYRTSHIDHTFSISNHLYDFRRESVHAASIGPIEGVAKDTILSNDINKYMQTNMVYSKHPNSQDNYLIMPSGSIIVTDESTGFFTFYSLNKNYPIDKQDTLKLYISNHYIENSNSFLAPFPIYMEYIDSLNTFNDLITSMPIYRTLEPIDSIVISYGFPPFNADYLLGDQSIYPIEYDVPFSNFYNWNQSNQISGNFNFNMFYSQYTGLRSYDYNHSSYELLFMDSILLSGQANEFPNPYYVDSSGVYQLTIENNSFFLNDSSAKLIMKNTFDLSEEDPNPPSLTSFRILDSENRISSTIKQYNKSSVFFSAIDGYDFEANIEFKPYDVVAYFKLHSSEDWIPIDVVANDIDDVFIGYGYYYTIDLDPIYDTMGEDDVLIDLRIVLTDEVGNESEHSWYSAFKVISTINTSELSKKSQNMTLFPNPTNDGTYISFDQKESSDVSISIWNLEGKLVNTITKAKYSAGNHKIFWDGSDLSGKKVPAGIYFVNMKSSYSQETIQLIIQ